jgi:hypothetical protein
MPEPIEYHRSITRPIACQRQTRREREKPAVAGLLHIAGAGFEPATFGL